MEYMLLQDDLQLVGDPVLPVCKIQIFESWTSDKETIPSWPETHQDKPYGLQQITENNLQNLVTKAEIK